MANGVKISELPVAGTGATGYILVGNNSQGESNTFPLGEILNEIKASLTAIKNGKADASTVTSLQNSLTQLQTLLTSKANKTYVDEALNAIRTSLNGKASSTEVASINETLTTLSDRIDAAAKTTYVDDKVSALQQLITDLQNALRRKANTTDVDQLEADLGTLSNRVDAKADTSYVDSKVSELRQADSAIQTALNNKASKTELSALERRVQSNESKIDARATKTELSTLTNTVKTKATKTYVDNELSKKVDIAQGVGAAGHVLGVNSSGNVVPVQLAENIVNVGKRGSGYHTWSTAIQAVPANKRIPGVVVTWMSSANSYDSKQFVGTDVTREWTDDTKWKGFGGGSGSGSGFYNLDNENPLPDGQKYTLERAVATVAASTSLSDETKNGMIITFYDGGEWKTYRYKYMFVGDPEGAANFANVENWGEFESGGGGGSQTSRIVLRRITPNITTKVGEQILLSFYFDHVTGEGSDEQTTGNSGRANITITRGGSTVRQTRTIAAGTHVLDMTTYCDRGVTTIRVQVEVDTGADIQTSAIAWTVNEVQLDLTSSSLSGYTVVPIGSMLRVDYGLESGSNDTKAVVLYVDGVQKASQTTSVAVSSGTLVADTASLTPGAHTIQLRAQQSTGEYVEEVEQMLYSNLLYAVVCVYDSNLSVAVATCLLDIPDGSTIFGEEETPVVDIKQYETYTIRYGAYKKDASSVNVVLYENGVQIRNAAVSGSEGVFTVRPLTDGVKHYTLTADGTAEVAFDIDAEHVQLNIERPAGQTLFLDAVANGHSNTDSNRDTWTCTEGGVTTTSTFSGFYWVGDGWINGAMRIRNEARLTVGYAPLRNTSSGGSSVGFKYKCTNVLNEDSRVISCVDANGTGFFITPKSINLVRNNEIQNTMLTAEGVTYDVQFIVWSKSKTTVEGRKNYGMVYMYIDGIISGGFRMGDTETFFQSNPVPITFGSSEATLDLYRVWAYQRSLTDAEALACYIYDQDDNMEKMLTLVEENDILDTNGNITIDSLPNGTRIVILTGQAYSASLKRTMASVLAAAQDNEKSKYFPLTEIKSYIKGAEDRSKNFVFRPVGSSDKDIRLQGTSSLAYPVKNYRIYTKKGEMYVNIDPDADFSMSGELVPKSKFAMHDGSAPVNVWCLKADYAESSSSHNTGMARMANDALVNRQILTPAQEQKNDQYPYEVRTTVDGEPCVLFYRETLNDAPVYFGKFNFNNDKSTEAVYGFTGINGYHDVAPLNDVENGVTHFLSQQYHALHKNDEGYEQLGDLTECWEFKNNEALMGSFLDDDFVTTVTDDEGTYPRWMGCFEARYPDEDDINEDMTAGRIIPHYLSTLVSWVKSTRVLDTDTEEQAAVKREKFRNELKYYFNVEHLCAYYSFTQIMACLDQMVKNMMMGFWYDPLADDGDQGSFATNMGKVRAYMIFYDNDTILGVINDGNLRAPFDVTRQTMYNDSYFYAGHDSVLWNNLEACFPNEIKDAYGRLRTYLTNERIFQYFDTDQTDKWCERLYNLDAINKYVSPTGWDEAAVSPYRSLMQGNRKSHRHYFVENRLVLLDNQWQAGEYETTTNQIEYKGNSPAGSAISLKLLRDGNVKVDSDVSEEGFTGLHVVQGNTLFTLNKATASAIGTTIHVRGVRLMTMLDVSKWNFSQLRLGTFPYLEEFVFNRSEYTDFTKPEFGGTLSIGASMPVLKKFVSQNCTTLRTVDFSGCELLEEIDLTGCTAMTSINIAQGTPLTKYIVPASGGYNLTLLGLPKLERKTGGLEILDMTSILSLRFAGCPLINGYDLVKDIVLTSGNRLSRIYLEIGTMEGSMLDLLAIAKEQVSAVDGSKVNGMKGFDANGNEIDGVGLYGTFTVTDIATDELKAKIAAYFPYLDVHYAAGVSEPVLQCYDEDSPNYNPAAAIVLANAGIGTTVSGSRGWYMTAAQAAAVSSCPSFRNKVDVADTNLLVPASGGDNTKTYEFTDASWMMHMTALKEVPYQCFYNCTKLESVTLPDGLTTIGTHAFNNCTKLESVTLPNGLTTIGERAFNNCSSLESITLPNSVAGVLAYTFYNCKSLSGSVTVPNGVTNLSGGSNNGVFTYTKLTKVDIGTGVTNIVAGCFRDVPLEVLVVRPTTPPTLGDTFNNFTNVQIYVPDASLSAYQGASVWSKYASNMKPLSQLPA